MSKYQYLLSCTINVLPENFDSISDYLEISIPCVNCEREHRTIVFKEVGAVGICTPREKCSGFPGRLTAKEIIPNSRSVVVNYLIDFIFEPFIDKKYNSEIHLLNLNWARSDSNSLLFLLSSPILPPSSLPFPLNLKTLNLISNNFL